MRVGGKNVEWRFNRARGIMRRMERTDLRSEDMVNIAARLKALREALDLSQAEMCRRIGATPPQWNNWERATARIRVDVAIRLAQTFGVTLDWIYTGDARMMPHSLMERISARVSAAGVKPGRKAS